MILLIEIFLLTYLTGCVLYNLFFSIAGKCVARRPSPQPETDAPAKVAILVPAYKEDAVILSVARSYAELDYPKQSYDVWVIADSLQPETLRLLEAAQVHVLPVSFDKSTKAKSLNAALAHIGEGYELVLISDADNVLAPDFLTKVNQAYRQGHHAIQAQRVAKNIETPFAVLDTANEIIANHIYRKGSNAVGLSSSVIGSGMVFHYPLIKSVMENIDATGGFDKVLQLEVVSRGHRIHYLEDALIFDEKVENSAAFSNQRRRWISSQFLYFRQFWKPGLQNLLKGNFDYFNLAFCHNLMLPRMLLIAAIVFLAACSLVFGSFLTIPLWCWGALFLLNMVSLALPLPALFYRRYMLTAMLSLPKAMWMMVMILFRIKGANKSFIHTQHHKTDINNPLLNVARKN
ncbi:glycosyltransferase family 2 protein [Chitinophaga sp.]|uniref:glycosyltransferase n=1 Tax=Chitinophaga sp. TaxID=1869181 RepID=UPI00262BB170|nr:glycosyltransferase family 2 protein [uncultured Chitinophaga sp.]